MKLLHQCTGSVECHFDDHRFKSFCFKEVATHDRHQTQIILNKELLLRSNVSKFMQQVYFSSLLLTFGIKQIYVACVLAQKYTLNRRYGMFISEKRKAYAEKYMHTFMTLRTGACTLKSLSERPTSPLRNYYCLVLIYSLNRSWVYTFLALLEQFEGSTHSAKPGNSQSIQTYIQWTSLKCILQRLHSFVCVISLCRQNATLTAVSRQKWQSPLKQVSLTQLSLSFEIHA